MSETNSALEHREKVHREKVRELRAALERSEKEARDLSLELERRTRHVRALEAVIKSLGPAVSRR